MNGFYLLLPEIIRQKTSNKSIDNYNFFHIRRVGERESGFNAHGSKRPHWRDKFGSILEYTI